MSALARARACAIGLSSLLVIAGWSHVVCAAGATTTPVQRGQRIFLHIWQPNDPMGKGDGLGPVFNERSCVGCHFLGGVGGSGPNDRNIELLTAVVPSDLNELKKFPARAKLVHPGFADSTSIVLHRFGTNAAYPLFRSEIIVHEPSLPDLPTKVRGTGPSVKQLTAPPTGQIQSIHDVELLLTRRNTPALFGASLIDSISPRELDKIVEEQAKEDWPVSGRLVGRFGWRGQIADLREFVMGACADEVGLQNPNHAQGMDPQNAKRRAPALDLSQEQCEDLIAYIASLPAPRQGSPSDPADGPHVEQGKNTFDSIGCAVCHRPYIDKVDGIYSDLLVHDMGQWLSDPVAAPSRPTRASMTSPGRPSGYFGGSSESEPPVPIKELAQRRSEWRTPPLWGVRDSAPYLHDGRAATLDEAIRWHGGEAGPTIDNYLALDGDDQQDLIVFLSTLAAPEAPAQRLAKK